jgi:hypothetical protein
MNGIKSGSDSETELIHPISVEIPFPGFYESRLDATIDQALEQDHEDYENGEVPYVEYWEIPYYNAPWAYIPMKELMRKMGVLYLECLSELLEFPVKFELIDSPREYNYGTDRLFAHIAQSDLIKMHEIIITDHHVKWCEYVKKSCSHRSGFVSHYSDNAEEWGQDLEKWDHNQWYHVLKFYTANVLEVDMIEECTTYVEDQQSRTGYITDTCYEYYKTNSETSIARGHSDNISIAKNKSHGFATSQNIKAIIQELNLCSKNLQYPFTIRSHSPMVTITINSEEMMRGMITAYRVLEDFK